MNILKIIAITLIIIVSFLVVFLKPKVHKKVRLENADFNVVQFSEKKIEKTAPPFYAPKHKSGPKQQYPRPQINNPSPREVIHVLAPKSTQMTQVQLPPPSKLQQQSNTEKQLTAEQQEIIAWNKWRSDLQNQVMRDSKVVAPIGTEFKFSFTVDKFGNISNLRIWTEPSYYTQMALRDIRPILLCYQGRSILNFPPESKRVIVNIEGHFSMAHTSKFSSPSDYSDYERVK